MEQIKVRIAAEDDIGELITLLTILFTQEAEFIPDFEKQHTGLRIIITNPLYGHILVATRKGKVAGMVNLLYQISTAEGAKVVTLEDMVVDPACRNFGVGSILLTEAIEFSKRQGCKRITLLTDVDNKRAIDFYSKQGFTRSTMVPLRLTL